jgi:hypothetical protein
MKQHRRPSEGFRVFTWEEEEGRGWEIDLEVASKKPRHHCCDHYRWSRVFDEPEPPS